MNKQKSLILFDYIQTGTTALYVAAQNGHLEVVEMLIAAKCQVNIQEKVSLRACTPQYMHVSFQNGYSNLIILTVYRMDGQHYTCAVKKATAK